MPFRPCLVETSFAVLYRLLEPLKYPIGRWRQYTCTIVDLLFWYSHCIPLLDSEPRPQFPAIFLVLGIRPRDPGFDLLILNHFIELD